MPHLYCDRRSDNEETQKLIHRDLLANLSQASAKLFGKDCPFSWDQAEVVASHTRDDGFSVVAFLKQEVMAELALKRLAQTLVRAFGCHEHIKRSFTMSAPADKLLLVPKKLKASSLSLKALKRESASDPVMKKENAVASPKATGTAGELPIFEELLFFSTIKGTLIHCKAPGEAWKQLCLQGKTKREVPAANVIEQGNFEQAKQKGAKFCPRCISAARLSLP